MFHQLNKFFPYLVIVIGLIISVFTGWFTYQYYKEKEHARLELASREITLHIKNRMALYEQLLRSGVALFNASDNITRTEWRIFAKEQQLSRNFKGIQGFGYSDVILPIAKESYEDRIRKEGFPDFSIKPKGQRELYTSISYLEPFNERNQKAFGYDMYSETIRQTAMTKAMQSGEATLSGKIKLLQENNKNIQAGFLMYLPVYKKDSKLDTPQDRVLATQGLIYAPFRANDLMNGILGSMFSNVDFELYSSNLPSKANILYDSNTNDDSALVYKTTNMKIYGQTWTLVFKTNCGLEIVNLFIIFLVPCLILGLTLLLYFLLNSLIKTKEKALEIATKATEKLKNSEERLRFSLAGSGDGLWDWNLVTNEVYFSKRWKEMLGFEEEEISNTLEEWKNRVHPDDLDLVYTDITAHIEGKTDIYINEHRVKCKDGSYKWVLDRGLIASRNIDGSPERMVGAHSDIGERKQSQLKLKEYMQLVDKNVISSTTDLDGKILRASEAFSKISGYSKTELFGHTHNILRHKDTPSELYKELWTTIQSGNIWHGEIKNKSKDGSDFWVDTTISQIKNENGETIGYTDIRHDITNKKRVDELSVTDRLTQLYNRLKLDEIFIRELASSSRYNTPFSVIMIDIDHFKSVNDTWGHQVGDDVLKEFALLIKNNVREADIVGRWGGEEFLILSPNIELDGAMLLSEKLRELVSLFKFSFAGHKTGSFGVSTFHPGDDAKSMVKRADNALYSAKLGGRNSVRAEEWLRS
jgi:diguanylate cyclase (GGDEF)-like protein/PAS domain S-box-containing protein